MSETILDHGYVPEEHAPDPVISHGDPTPPGKIAIWLFLASEIMFFIAILGSYIILRSGSPELFAKQAEILSKTLAGINTVVLIGSSLTMALAVDASQKGNAKRAALYLAITLACAFGFMGIKAKEYYDKFTHYTMTVVDQSSPTGIFVYDGHVHKEKDVWVVDGYRMAMPENHPLAPKRKPPVPPPAAGAAPDTLPATEPAATQAATEAATQPTTAPAAPKAPAAGKPFDIHLTSEADVKAAGEAVNGEKIPTDRITNNIRYGPWKSIFFACYFTLTGVHGLHVIGGMVPLSVLLIQALRGKLLPAHTEYTGLYWHFVDLVWIFLFPLMYLI